ncbi:MAG: hypothetical protein LM590_09095 [Thermofilum sp.]|nr:hypothetical protein [Thermofilum sp.]
MHAPQPSMLGSYGNGNILKMLTIYGAILTATGFIIAGMRRACFEGYLLTGLERLTGETAIMRSLQDVQLWRAFDSDVCYLALGG